MPSFERIKRGLRAILGVAQPDDAWAWSWLLPQEYALYARLDPRDREHAVLVAKALLKRFPDAPPAAVRAALLHDLGKMLRPYHPFERILTALLEPWLPKLPPQPLREGWRGAVQLRLHHERYALELVEDPEVRAVLEELAARSGTWGVRIWQIDETF